MLKVVVLSYLFTLVSACSTIDDPVPADNDDDPVTQIPTEVPTQAPGGTDPTTPKPSQPNDGEDIERVTPNPNGDIGVTVDPPTYRNNSVFVPHPTDIGDHIAFYSQDGYATPSVIRMDVRVDNTVQGVCTIDDQSGCTLDDVLADINGKDDFKVEIAVHASGEGLPDDGELTNATLRQRGNTARNGPQKSFRLKLDSKETLWRSERRLQLNKNPFESSRIKNKLSFDLFQGVPHFPSLRAQFVNLWIDNGQGPEDFGLFTHTEFIGKEYVANRQLHKDDNLYKIEFFRFSQGDLNSVQVDANGAPLDEAAFATRLEIENGTDHRMVVKMLESMVDPERSLESVIEQHFNENNILTWLATNLILRQPDAITHNFYLYNPAGTERFYILPWDYDGTFEPEPVLTNDVTNAQLQQRLFFGYARGINSRFVDRYYRMPGAHERLVRAIDELRANYYSDEQIFQRATILNNLVEPFLTQLPDSQNVLFEPTSPQRFVGVVNDLYTTITTGYGIPMPHEIETPVEIDEFGTIQLTWSAAFDVTRQNTLTYDLIIATDPSFAPATWVFSDAGIPDSPDGTIVYSVSTSSLPLERVYVRVIARGSTNPQQVWQISRNALRLPDGSDLFGMIEIDLR